MVDPVTIILTAEDKSAPGVTSFINRFADIPKSLRPYYKELTDGTALNTKALETQARRSGLATKQSIDAYIKRYEDAAEATIKQRKEAEKAGKATQGSMGLGAQATALLTARLGPAGAAMAMFAAKAVTAGSAMEFLRRGYMGFAKFDEQLRLTQNSTGLLSKDIQKLGDEMKDLAALTGKGAEELLHAYNTLRETGNFGKLPLPQLKKMFEDATQAAIGVGAPLDAYMRTVGDMMRNLKVPAEDYMYVLNALTAANKEFNLNLEETGPALSKATQMMAAWGYEGVDAAQRATAMLGVMKGATGSARLAATGLVQVLQGMSSAALGTALGFEPSGEEFQKFLLQQEDALGAVIGLIRAAPDKERVRRALGIEDMHLWKALLDADVGGKYVEMLQRIKKEQLAVAGGQFIGEGPLAQVNKLIVAVKRLGDAFGELLDAVGVTVVLDQFGRVVNTIAISVEKIARGIKYITHGEWLHRETPKLPYGTVIPRGQPGAATDAPEAPTTPPGASVPSVPATPGAAPAPATPEEPAKPKTDAERGWFEPQPGRSPADAWRMWWGGSRQKPGGGQAPGAGAPGIAPGTIAPTPPPLAQPMGYRYGSSMDARVLPAAYHPGGGIYVYGGPQGGTGPSYRPSDERAGPGRTGTGYGGGQTLAPPGTTRPSGPSGQPGVPGQAPSEEVLDAIQKQEGWFPGSRSFRNNNPGNIKYGPHAIAHGATGKDEQGHAIFPNYESGRNALRALLQRPDYAGKSLAEIGPRYAEDPNWAAGVAKQLKTGTDYVPSPRVEGGGDGTPGATTGTPGTPGKQTAEQAGIKPEFPTGNINWRGMDAETVARFNAAYRDMPPEVRATWNTTSGFRYAWRKDAIAAGANPESSQEAIWERSGHGTRFAAAPPGHSRHGGAGTEGRGTALDIQRSPALSWLHRHGHKYGLEGILGGEGGRDPVHIQSTRRGPNFLPGQTEFAGRAPSTQADVQGLEPGRQEREYRQMMSAEADKRWDDIKPPPSRDDDVSDLKPGSPGRTLIPGDYEGNYNKIQKMFKESLGGSLSYDERENLPLKGDRAEQPTSGKLRGLEREFEKGRGFIDEDVIESMEDKRRMRGNRGYGQDEPVGYSPEEEDRQVNLNLKVNDADMQFARASMRRQADREVRETRWNSYSDIGAA